MDRLALQKETSIDLYNQQLSFSAIKNLAEIIKTNNKLTYLNLSFNYIGDEAIEEIACALEHNRSLTHLNLDYNKIGDKGTQALCNALRNNQTLKKLSLRHNQIGHAQAHKLATTLEENQNLTYLDLGFNSITHEGVKAIIEMLEKSSLKYLNLECTELSDNSLSAIAVALKTNTTLTYLNISYNMMEADSMQILTNSLQKNKTLKHLGLSLSNTPPNELITQALITVLLGQDLKLSNLNLSGSAINSANIKALAEALKKNQSITHLDLSYSNLVQNEGDNPDIQPLVLALEENHTLTELNLDSAVRWGSNFSLQTQAHLKNCIERNIKENKSITQEIEHHCTPPLSYIITDYAAIPKIEKKHMSDPIISTLPESSLSPTPSLLFKIIHWIIQLRNHLWHFMSAKKPDPALNQSLPPSKTVNYKIYKPQAENNFSLFTQFQTKKKPAIKHPSIKTFCKP